MKIHGVSPPNNAKEDEEMVMAARGAEIWMRMIFENFSYRFGLMQSWCSEYKRRFIYKLESLKKKNMIWTNSLYIRFVVEVFVFFLQNTIQDLDWDQLHNYMYSIEVKQQLAALVLGWVTVWEKPQCCSSVDECIDLAGAFLGRVSPSGRKPLHWSMTV